MLFEVIEYAHQDDLAGDDVFRGDDWSLEDVAGLVPEEWEQEVLAEVKALPVGGEITLGSWCVTRVK